MDTVFLSYAKEDKARIDEIYKALRLSGLNPWMDTPPRPYNADGIPPGVNWDNYIREELKDAGITLLFLSKQSIAKRGYIQKEYRLALSFAAERPPDEVSLIPVLIEKCEPPTLIVDSISLRGLQWYRLYEDSLETLIFSLKRIIQPKNSDLTNLPISVDTVLVENRVLFWRRKSREKDRILARKDDEIKKLKERNENLLKRSAENHFKALEFRRKYDDAKRTRRR